MFSRIIRTLLTFIGVIIGFFIAMNMMDLLPFIHPEQLSLGIIVLIYISSCLLFGIVMFLLSPLILESMRRFAEKLDKHLHALPFQQLLLCCLGLIIGLTIGWLLSNLFDKLPQAIALFLDTILFLALGYLGIMIPYKRYKEMPAWLQKRFSRQPQEPEEHPGAPKLLDSSAIIDGRILDAAKTGFVTGPFIVPCFILDELRHIADSSDGTKRMRGRRGLDILAQMQKELEIPIILDDTEYTDVKEVDLKLLKLATQMSGSIVTTDYNLNKVAKVNGIRVLNINDLANAMRPVLANGETMRILITKPGREPEQGVGYLDDGTMVVVDAASGLLGEEVDVTVTGTLQTSAGRMVFAQIYKP